MGYGIIFVKRLKKMPSRKLQEFINADKRLKEAESDKTRA